MWMVHLVKGIRTGTGIKYLFWLVEESESHRLPLSLRTLCSVLEVRMVVLTVRRSTFSGLQEHRNSLNGLQTSLER